MADVQELIKFKDDTFLLGDPGLDINSRSLLAKEVKSHKSARVGCACCELCEVGSTRPKYFLVAIGLGFGLSRSSLPVLKTISFSSSELYKIFFF